MTAAEYATELTTDTSHLRPRDPGTVTYVKATSSLGTLQLELSAGRIYGAIVTATDERAHDFLWDTCRALEVIR